MKLPAKALIASTLLLVVPLITISMVRQHATELQAVHEASLASTAAMIGSTLAQHPLVIASINIKPQGSEPLFAHRLRNWVEVDGKADDFGQVSFRTLSVDDTLQVNTPFDPASLRVALRTGADRNHLFLHVAVTDDRVVYRELGNLSVHRNDHVQIAFVDPDGNYRRYTVAPSQPGPADVFRITSFDQGSRALRPDEEIEGYWLATENGYNLEVRIPMAMMTSAFAVSVSDVDDDDSRKLRYTLGSANTAFREDLGRIILPNPALDELLADFDVQSSLTLVDNANRLLATTDDGEPPEGIWRNVSGPTLPLPFYLNENNPMAASQTLTIGDETAAVLYVTESRAGLERAINSFVESIFLVSLAFIAFAMALIFGFTTWISRRTAALRERLMQSVDPQGRVIESLPEAILTDELGELQNTFKQLTDRLQQYNRYLEEISRRLSHELRTPITVVSSSLDHLSMQEEGPGDVYIERAREGVSRLTRILSSMSEATRLEASLNPEDIEYFDLAAVISGCVSGYEVAYPEQDFELSIEAELDKILGLPDLISQLMDKLIGNAIEFAADASTIRIRLTREKDDAVLRVINEGPALPAEGDHLFDSMISIRSGAHAGETHLGLGLYIARLIAEFHGGGIRIENRADTSGVIVTTRIPLMRIRGRRD